MFLDDTGNGQLVEIPSEGDLCGPCRDPVIDRHRFGEAVRFPEKLERANREIALVRKGGASALARAQIAGSISGVSTRAASAA